MTDPAILRRKMVDEQLIMRGVRDPQVIGAMYRVERHRFIPEEGQSIAYSDGPVAIDRDQTISQPYIVGLMTESLRLSKEHKVLEVGTGSGYQTALLAELAGEVRTIERFPELSSKAEALLNSLGYGNIRFAVGDGSLGWREEAPFDRIIVTAACPRLPFPLAEQLKEGGLILLPIGENFSQTLTLGVKKDGVIKPEPVCECVFVPLVGEFGLFHK